MKLVFFVVCLEDVDVYFISIFCIFFLKSVREIFYN